jgi:hypothetical protein
MCTYSIWEIRIILLTHVKRKIKGSITNILDKESKINLRKFRRKVLQFLPPGVKTELNPFWDKTLLLFGLMYIKPKFDVSWIVYSLAFMLSNLIDLNKHVKGG